MANARIIRKDSFVIIVKGMKAITQNKDFQQNVFISDRFDFQTEANYLH